VRLSRKEALFFRALLMAKGEHVKSGALLDFMGYGQMDADIPLSTTTVHTRANRLRAKIGRYIPRTESDLGYRLVPRDAALPHRRAGDVSHPHPHG